MLSLLEEDCWPPPLLLLDGWLLLDDWLPPLLLEEDTAADELLARLEEDAVADELLDGRELLEGVSPVHPGMSSSVST